MNTIMDIIVHISMHIIITIIIAFWGQGVVLSRS